MKASDKRMTSERCAHLSFVAIVNQLEEAWLCFFPALPLIYFGQYMPTIGKRYIQSSITNVLGLGHNFRKDASGVLGVKGRHVYVTDSLV